MKKFRFDTKVAICMVGFSLAILLVAADEVLDIPFHLFGAPSTPINWTEVIIESSFILTVASLTSYIIWRLGLRSERVEEELVIAEQSFRNSIENSPLGIRIVTTEGELLYANKAVLDIFGYDSIEECKAVPEEKRLTPQSLIELQERQEKSRLGKPVPSPFEMTIVRKNGEIRNLLVHRKTLVWNGEVQIQLIHQDITEHKKMEEELRQSEEKYYNLVENAPVGITITTFDGQTIEVNKAMLEMYRYDSKEEFMKIPASGRYYDPADREHFISLIAKGPVKDFQAHRKRKDGTSFWASVTAIPWTSPLGERGFITITQDVTERRQAEEALRQSEEKLRLMFESLALGVSVTDQDGKIVEVNEAKVRMHGYDSKEELIGRGLLVLIAEKDRARGIEERRQRLERGYMGNDLYTYIREHGSHFLGGASGTVLRDVSGKPIGFITITEDITGRKQAEEVLRQSEEKLRLMFESLALGITVTDLDAKILEVNEAKVRMHGYDSKEELIGRSVLELIAEKDGARVIENRRRRLEHGYMGNDEYTYLRKDGSEFPGEVSNAVLRDVSGKPIGFISILEDISERKRMQEQLAIVDRLASIGQLASGIAHELNNPLTSVIGFSELLLERPLPSDIKEDVKIINREAQRTAQIIRGLLTFARKQGTEKTLVDINSIIQGVLQVRSYEQKVSNIQVNTGFAAELPQVMGNGAQLQQVFINIIVNAEQAMVEAHGRGALTVTTEQVGNVVRASFADDGPGINPEDMKQLFTPFFTTKEVGKGTGLGLSICHGIVTEHGGRIYAESELGKGTTFIVELPISSNNKGGTAK